MGLFDGHGVRLALKPVQSTPEQLLDKELDFTMLFEFTVFNFNPSILDVKNSYGWVSPKSGGGGEGKLNGDYPGGKPSPNMATRQFDAKGNKKTYEIAGTVFAKEKSLLDLAFGRDPSALELMVKLDYMARAGVSFYLMKPDTIGVKSLGMYTIMEFNYSMSNFTYGANPAKTTFSILLEEFNG